jgi:hypothetical protein
MKPDDPGTVLVDIHAVKDAAWLLTALQEFARIGDIVAVNEMLRFTNTHLSADGLTRVAGNLASQLSSRIAPSQ